MRYHPPADKNRITRPPIAPKLPPSLVAAELHKHDFEDDCVLQSIDYNKIDLTARRFESIEVSHCRFINSKLTSTHLNRAAISDVIFEQCDLASLSVMNSSLLNSCVSSSRLTGVSWSDSLFRETFFDTCRIDMANFRFSRFKHVLFQNCNLHQADFQNADLRGACFEHCDLSDAQFSNADMNGARFVDCNLIGICGVTSLKGATVRSDDVLSLAHSLANALGINIEK